MSSFKDRSLAKSLAGWFAKQGCTISMIETTKGFSVYYTLKNDTKPQPPVEIRNGRVIFPRGSQMAVVNAFFGGFDV